MKKKTRAQLDRAERLGARRHLRGLKRDGYGIGESALDRQVRRSLIDSPITHCMLAGLRQKVQVDRHGFALVPFPKIFSLIDNPIGSVETLAKLVTAARHPTIKCLFVDHAPCERLGLGASLLTDILVVAARKEWRRMRREVAIGGAHAQKPEVKEMLRAAGLIKTLRVQGETLEREAQTRLLLFPLREGKRAEVVLAHRSTDQELLAEDLAKYFDRCLVRHGWELSRHGKALLTRMVGEVVDNAEEHSGTRRWWAIGYYRQSELEPEGLPRGECSISIFSFGRSIAETLRGDSVSSELRDEIERLVVRHRRRRLFSRRWSEEALWTLYSLQEGVTRLYGKPRGRDRGQGLARLIEFFLELGQSTRAGEKASMALVSGHTHLRFDGKYGPSTVLTSEGGKRQVIALNADNDLDQPPDPDYCTNLPLKFPGTLLSMRFYIDPECISA